MSSDVNIHIDREKCYGCGICVERCILDNLRLFLAPCRAACPVHMNCQGYVRLIAQGKEEEAAMEMRLDFPFAGIAGRVCHHPCEEKCERRNVDGGAVHLRALKRFLAEGFPKTACAPDPLAPRTEKRVAIVGSGPAGLMAAYDLARQGHGVTVLEAEAEPGGMLRRGIPAFRLPSEEIDRAVQVLCEMGVCFATGEALGKDYDLERLEREWDAVLLALGGGKPATLGIPGEEMDEVRLGLDLLRAAREGRPPRLGRSAIVLGGGNAAVDAALVCRRLGVKEVTLISLEDPSCMPAFPQEVEEAREEGIKIQNGWGARNILRRGDGTLRLELSRCLRVFDEHGNFAPLLDHFAGLSPGVDSVVVAIGQLGRHPGLPADLCAPVNPFIPADPLTLQTARPAVFAAGDAAFGPQSVIQAMAQGREAALSIHRLLKGETLRWGRAPGAGAWTTDFPVDRSGAVLRQRARLPKLALAGRRLNVEVEQTLSAEQARAEAERCLNCGRPAEVHQTCWYCLPCEIECPAKALEVRLPYLVR